jgi:hypothetical protein
MQSLPFQDQRAFGFLQAAIEIGAFDTITAQIENFMNETENEAFDSEEKVIAAIKEIEDSGPLFVKFVDYVLEQFSGNEFVVCAPEHRSGFNWFKIWFEEWLVYECTHTFFTKEVLVTIMGVVAGRTITLFFEKEHNVCHISDLTNLALAEDHVKVVFLRSDSFIRLERVPSRYRTGWSP